MTQEGLTTAPAVPVPAEDSVVRITIPAAVALLVYGIVYVALRLLPDQTYGAWWNTAVQLVGDVACVYYAWRAAQATDSAWRGFFRSIAIASAFLLVANVAWGVVINVWALNPNAATEALTYRVPYLLCLTFWVVAWVQVVVQHLNRGATAGLMVMAILMGGSLAALLVKYYGPLVFDSANPHRVFVLLYVGLEIIALLFCTGSAVIQVQPYPVLIALGYSLLVAVDFVFNTNELRNVVPQNSLIEIPWTIAQVLVAVGIVVQQRLLARKGAETAGDSNADRHFAIPLLCLTLGSGLAAAVIARFVRPDPVAFGCYLFCIAMVAIGISVLGRQHSAALDRAFRSLAVLTRRGPLPAQSSDRALILRMFGSAAIIDRAEKMLLDVREQTIPRSFDHLFEVEHAWAAEKPRHVFLAMPFGGEGAEAADRWFRSVIAELQWVAVRADESFESRDALDGVWKSICEAEIVLAHLTGQNPNVLYEVGIAHCLGKPVVFVSDTAEHIPFDLATRRVVIYKPGQHEQVTSKLKQALLACSATRA